MKKLSITEAVNGWIVEIYLDSPVSFEDQIKAGMDIARRMTHSDDVLDRIRREAEEWKDDQEERFSRPYYVFTDPIELMAFVRDFFLWQTAS